MSDSPFDTESLGADVLPVDEVFEALRGNKLVEDAQGCGAVELDVVALGFEATLKPATTADVSNVLIFRADR